MATLETSPGDEMTFPGSQFDDESSDATGPHPPSNDRTKVYYPLVVSESLGLSIEERGREIQRLLGFNQSILAYRLDENSQRMYCRDFYSYLEFAGTVDEALRPATLARWMNHLATARIPGTEKGYSPNTINRMASAVRKIMKEAGKQGFIDPRVAESFAKIEGVSVKALKGNLRKNNRVRIERETMRLMSDSSELDRLMGLRNHAILHTLASTGLRIETFRLLTQDQVLRRAGGYTVHVRGKNEIEFRDVPLSDEAYEAIQAWVAARPVSSKYLFTRFDGGSSDSERPRLSARPLSAVSIRAIVKQYAKAVGLVDEDGKVPVKPHDLRRFVGTTLAKTKGVVQAKLVLGHKKVSTTIDHYVLDEVELGITNDLF